MFAAPAFLAALLAIGLPVWLHRIAQANPARHPFPSLMLMEASEVQRTSRRTLRYWLLLALRIALLCALVFAFAGPLLPQRAVPAANPAGRLHAIVVDGSLSMQFGGRWQRAISEVESVIESARRGDELMLVHAAGHHVQVMQDAVGIDGAASVRSALAGMRPGSERLDFGLLMTTAKGWLGAARLPVEFHLISDLQHSASPLRFADLEPPAGARLTFHDVGPAEPAGNTYVRDAHASADGKLSVQVRTTVNSAQSLQLVALLDEQEIARRSFQIGAAPQVSPPREGEGIPPENLLRSSADAFASTEVVLQLPETSPVPHRMEVRLEPSDALAQDDRYYFVLEQKNPRVLVVARANNADEAVYSKSAIDALSAPKLQSEAHAAQELDLRTLQQYAAIIVTDPAALSSDATGRMMDFVRSGGSLLMTLNAGAHAGLLADWRVRDVVSRATQVAHVDATHPILRIAAGWSGVHIARYVQVSPATTDRVLITLDDDAPLLIERNVGAGHVLMLTSPLARDWNDLATHPVFVRFMADTASYMTDAEASTSSAQVGGVFMTGLNERQGGQIFDPQGQRVLALGESSVPDRIVPEHAGFYEIRTAGASRWIAVNTDARESDLARMSNVTLQRWQSLQKPGSHSANIAASNSTVQEDRVSIGPALLLVCLVLLLAEMVAANHFLAIRREVPR